MAELGAKTGGWKSKIEVSADEASGETPLPGSKKMSSRCVLAWWEGVRGLPGVPFTRALIPLEGSHPRVIMTTSTLRGGCSLQHRNFEGTHSVHGTHS